MLSQRYSLPSSSNGEHSNPDYAPCPCAAATMPSSSTPPVAEWIPLDDIVAQWSVLAQQSYTTESAIALHVLGEAFAALALEHSACTEYALATSQERAQTLRASSRDLDACLQELKQAASHWISIAYWLPRLEQTPPTFLEVVRTVAASTRTQSRRLDLLIERVQQEQVRLLRTGIARREAAR